MSSNYGINTILEHRTDLLMFFRFIINSRKILIINTDFSFAELLFVKSITLNKINVVDSIFLLKIEKP